MNDLLQSQIKEQCKINMPNGLKELMSDISREVLRAQPSNLYHFIADYLLAMLVTRDYINVSSQVCSNICQSDCKATIISKLQQIGLEEADVEVAGDVIMKYLSKEKVNEGNLVSVLMKKTEIDPNKFPEIVNVVRAAYLRQQTFNLTDYKTAFMSGDEEIQKARAHTLNLYRQSKPTQEMYHAADDKIKFACNSYGINSCMKTHKDYTAPLSTSNSFDNVQVDDIEMNSIDSLSEDLKTGLTLTAGMLRNRISTLSSLSLAGSFCCLPKWKPYNANDDIEHLSEFEESSEKQHSNNDYSTKLHEIFDETNANNENKINYFDDDDFVTNYDKKTFHDFDDELFDESLTIVSNKSDDIYKDIIELNEESEVSFNTVPDEELNINGFDYNVNNNNDILNNDSNSENKNVFTEVVISCNIYDSKEPTTFAKLV